MQHYGKAIHELLKEKHLTQREFAKRADISADTVRRVLKQESPEGSHATTYRAIAHGLGLSVEQLDQRLRSDETMGGENIAGASVPFIDLHGGAGGRFDIDAGQAWGHIAPPPTATENDLMGLMCFRMKGDSMSPEIAHSDLVYCSSTENVHDGATCLVLVGDETALVRRCVVAGENTIIFVAHDPEIPSVQGSLDDFKLIAPIKWKLCHVAYMTPPDPFEISSRERSGILRSPDGSISIRLKSQTAKDVDRSRTGRV